MFGSQSFLPASEDTDVPSGGSQDASSFASSVFDKTFISFICVVAEACSLPWRRYANGGDFQTGSLSRCDDHIDSPSKRIEIPENAAGRAIHSHCISIQGAKRYIPPLALLLETLEFAILTDVIGEGSGLIFHFAVDTTGVVVSEVI